MYRRLLQQLTDLQGSLNDGLDISAEGIDALMGRIRDAAPKLDKEEIRQLDGAIRQIELVARDRFEEIGEELRRLNQGRTALRGYNHLRGIDGCQRLYRRA
jgi:hypothetical protein